MNQISISSAPPAAARRKPPLGLFLLITFFDVTAFAMTMLTLTFMARARGASDLQLGCLLAAYSATLILSAPVTGRLADRFGRRPMMLVSFTGSLLGYLWLGLDGALWTLFASRALDAMTGSNFALLQTSITDISTVKTRARALGLFGAMFGLGFIVGPVVAGGLGEIRYALAAYAAAALSLINLFLIFFFSRETRPEPAPGETNVLRASVSPRPSLFAFFSKCRERYPETPSWLLVRVFYGVTFGLFEVMFSPYVEARFGLSPAPAGMLMAFAGLVAAAAQGGAAGRLAARFGEGALTWVFFLVIAGGLAGWAFSPTILFLTLVLIPLGASGGLLNTLSRSALTKVAPPEDMGATLGVAASINSLTRVIAPIGGGWAMQVFGLPAPGAAGALVALMAAAYVVWRILPAWRARMSAGAS